VGHASAEPIGPLPLNTSTPSTARIYDYLLGGKDNYAVDREAAHKILAVFPEMPDLAWANRRFAARAARYCAGRGIRQYLDIGTGLPTSPSVAEVVCAERVPDAVAPIVVGVDNDPVVLVHDVALLPPGTHIVEGDVRDLDKILDQVAGLIDFDAPVAVFLVALLHFIADEEDPWRIVATIRDRLAPGSRIVISHGTGTGSDPDQVARILEVYKGASAPGNSRSYKQILRFFHGLELEEPWLVPVQEWRPDRIELPTTVTILGGIGRVPGVWE
jgi:SAM-dependent methyltransferase